MYIRNPFETKTTADTLGCGSAAKKPSTQPVQTTNQFHKRACHLQSHLLLRKAPPELLEALIMVADARGLGRRSSNLWAHGVMTSHPLSAASLWRRRPDRAAA